LLITPAWTFDLNDGNPVAQTVAVAGEVGTLIVFGGRAAKATPQRSNRKFGGTPAEGEQLEIGLPFQRAEDLAKQSFAIDVGRPLKVK